MMLFHKMLTNRDLYLLLKSPIINATKKHSIFKALFEGKLSKTTLAFFDIIVTKGREMYLPEITNEFIRQYKVKMKVSTVHLTTAAAVSEQQLADIKNKL